MPFTSPQYLLADHPRTLFPLDVTRIVIEEGADRVFQYIKDEIKPSGQGQPFSPQIRCYAAKHGLHLRRTVKLDPVSELFIYDLVLANRKFFKRDTRKRRRQYGYYFKSGRPVSAMTGYREFKRDLKRAEGKYPYGLKVDVATYFNSLYHHDLVHYFENLGWSQVHTRQLDRFLSEITGSRSVDCLPQGLHPCKVLGASFLHIVDRSSRLRSSLALRFLDDIHLFANDEDVISADFLHVQRLIGEKGLSLNSEKTVPLEGLGADLAQEIDEIKIGLLRVRSEWIEVSGVETETEVTEYEQLSDKQTEYLLGLIRDPGLEESDAELVLTLLSEHGEETLERMGSVWPRYPTLSKPIYNFVTRAFWDQASVASLAGLSSTGHRNIRVQFICWRTELQCFSRSLI